MLSSSNFTRIEIRQIALTIERVFFLFFSWLICVIRMHRSVGGAICEYVLLSVFLVAFIVSYIHLIHCHLVQTIIHIFDPIDILSRETRTCQIWNKDMMTMNRKCCKDLRSTISSSTSSFLEGDMRSQFLTLLL